mmetsp:Transcript_98264/g.204949  ORF Transcript_98264/g.204949 Transcript_98264/m.204949 type:complete len:806 (-) Transcript_98264:387-2804(-)|eukprot:CAMPEP_0206479930 /NCGR_PEP_ID=MMETSP0324_2-20121206/36957_1 /ASSEMBLY_ACC=CAM_ASM_000836 /TAXON_ID=2866 /ORGANISM="Crypthecodinium cohnii, Strain Seligo" /LENGTH=805 /DNA_ID=CAMNT_0053956551 /DNA_START=111 /DNA_END=2528 /DNA_ORIENTATION=+
MAQTAASAGGPAPHDTSGSDEGASYNFGSHGVPRTAVRGSSSHGGPNQQELHHRGRCSEPSLLETSPCLQPEQAGCCSSAGSSLSSLLVASSTSAASGGMGQAPAFKSPPASTSTSDPASASASAASTGNGAPASPVDSMGEATPSTTTLPLTASQGAATNQKRHRPSLRLRSRDFWVIPFFSVMALACGLPKLWGGSEEAGAMVALFLATSLAFGAFLDEKVLLSMFFPVKASGVHFSARVRQLNLVLCHSLTLVMIRICDPQRIEEHDAGEFTFVFIVLSYIDFIFGMGCAARQRALGLQPDLALYTSAAGPAVVYAIFLSYVAVRLNVSFLPLILATDTVIVFALPLVHVMVFSPHIMPILTNFFIVAPAGIPERELEEEELLEREGGVAAWVNPRVGYVALSVALWWHTPPLKVALLLKNTPPKMLMEWRTLTSMKHLSSGLLLMCFLVVILGVILLGVMAILMMRTCCRGCSRFSRFVRSSRADKERGTSIEEGSAMSLLKLLEEYEVATNMAECCWGTSFHFASRHNGESFLQSILRHQYLLASRLACHPKSRILDCGCGVGGPARNIARFTGSQVVGVTSNRFQAERGNALSSAENMSDRVQICQADLAKLPFPDASFDAVYAIESTCRSPNSLKVYQEISRVLKPGGIFACYEWCLTDKYDSKVRQHRAIKRAIEAGNCVQNLPEPSFCEQLLAVAGLEVRESRDCALDTKDGSEPWYLPLTPSYNPMNWPRFQFTPLMSRIMPKALSLAERCRLLPPRTVSAQTLLQAGGEGVARGGVEGIFTPMWLLVAKKPSPK